MAWQYRPPKFLSLKVGRRELGIISTLDLGQNQMAVYLDLDYNVYLANTIIFNLELCFVEHL